MSPVAANPSLSPKGAPPRTNPPPPPPVLPSSSSYQHGIPAVHQFENNNNTIGRGNPSLNPNTGQTNSYEYAWFGLALHELVDYQRTGNLILCIVTAFWIVLTTIWKRLFHPAQLVLSIYLCCMALALAVTDLVSVPAIHNQFDFCKALRDIITDNLGLLQHPVPGRVFYLTLLATLSWAIGGYVEWVLGCLFLLSGIITLYCWMTYPEYRKPYEEMEQHVFRKYYGSNNHNNNKNGQPTTQASWSYYFGKVATSTNNTGETESLLQQDV